MICGWFFIWPTLVLLTQAEADETSSAEAAVGNAGAANGIVIPGGLNPGAGNGMLLNGQAQLGQAQLGQAQLGQAQLGQLIPIGQPVFIPQSGLPIGQAGMPLVPGMGLQQALAFPMAQPQLPVPQMQPANGVPPLFAVVPQGGLQVPVLNPGQVIQILPLGAGNTIMQPMSGAQGAGNAARMVKRSAPADSVPTPSPVEPETFPVTHARPSLAEVLKLLTVSPERKPSVPEIDEIPEERNILPWQERPRVEESSGSGDYLDNEVLTNI
ncbi:uncharacterized protein LOC125720275 [Brienomyrus brachyistius]|uniref:uncharacterized protein LOC125720275 n=1 Tax=Brienomyrus brachyistius TaxID=42636 RepID=UPI0020B1B89F|nr:uncharacterized protein LOC125720275 [Brienomyrus brachyistius]